MEQETVLLLTDVHIIGRWMRGGVEAGGKVVPRGFESPLCRFLVSCKSHVDFNTQRHVALKIVNQVEREKKCDKMATRKKDNHYDNFLCLFEFFSLSNLDFKMYLFYKFIFELCIFK